MDSVGMEDRITALSLYHSALQGDWDVALSAYIENPSIHETTINSSGDTLLHVAVKDDKEDTVAKLVDAIKGNGSWSALKKKNDREGTPLHCAASRGSLKMCLCIAEAQGGDELLVARNKEGETPLFLPALNGHKDAFLYLHSRCPDHHSKLWRRTGDGKTVLHCTISREHFGIIVKPLTGSLDQQSNDNGTFLSRWIKSSPRTQTGADAENPSYYGFENVAPSNYRTCYDIFARLFTCFIRPVVETLGLQDVDDLKKKKEKHVWCRQILDQLWKYDQAPYVGGGNALQGYALVRTVQEKGFPKPGGDDKKKNANSNDDGDNQNQQKELLEFLTRLCKGEGENGEEWDRKELSALFIAAKNGVLEILEKIMKDRPGAIRETNCLDKNNVQVKNVNVDDNKLKELRELLTSLCKGNTSGSASKALSGCCIFLDEGEKKEEWDRKESALFIAAKNGVSEILEKIMKDKRGAIHETNTKGQNVLHVVVEYRQPHAFNLFKELSSKQRLWDDLVQSQDNEGNTVLHLAARLSEYKPWHIPGSTLQMQWEMKWFLYIKDITPAYVTFLPNNDHETPLDIFRKDHEGLAKEGAEWLKSTSESCSVVAALIAGVAFATSTTIPGGTQEETGKPYLEHQPAFNMFALTSLLALCCSITSLTMFLAILTSRHQPRDFRKDLPLKLLLGLSSLFISIASILVSFSAAFFLVLKHSLNQFVFPLYAATILPLIFYAVGQFPLYADLVKAIFSKFPQASNRESEKLIL